MIAGGHSGCAAVFCLQLEQFGLAERLVDDADAGPQQHVTVELAIEIAAEMPIGAEDYLLRRVDLREDRLRARTGDDDVGQRLHLGRAVDVGQRDVVGVRGAKRGEFFRRTGILQAAAGVDIGQHHDLFRAQDLGGLGHEPHSAKGDDLGIGRGGLAAQFKRIADEIGQILQFRLLIIMRQDHCLALDAQPVDLGAQVEAG